MTTLEIVKQYYDAKKPGKTEWKSLLADHVTFKGSGMPPLKGREALIGITQDLLERLESSETKKILIEENTACVLNRYNEVNQKGEKLSLDTAEIVEVQNGKITSFDVYFDSKAFLEFLNG